MTPEERREKRRGAWGRRSAASKKRELESKRLYRLKNRDRCLSLQKAWRERNRDKRRADKKARKIKKRQTIINTLMPAQRGRCAYCRSPLWGDFHIDHIVARSKGGADDRLNYQLTCQSCNQSKHAKDPIDFAQECGLLL